MKDNLGEELYKGDFVFVNLGDEYQYVGHISGFTEDKVQVDIYSRMKFVEENGNFKRVIENIKILEYYDPCKIEKIDNG